MLIARVMCKWSKPMKSLVKTKWKLQDEIKISPNKFQFGIQIDYRFRIVDPVYLFFF